MSNYADYVKGKGLVLITGKKGSGKSHFATQIIKDLREKYPDHKVYADITGLKVEGVELSPDDWHDVPNNCTIFYDEIQLKAWADNSNTKISSDVRVKDMTLIRKQNKNIVLMTQDPMFIHSALRKLVDYHYHLSHPFKDGKPKVFYFAGAMSNIDDKGAYQTHALETFSYHLDPEISKLYESIEPDAVHDQKRKIPKRIIYMIAFIAFLILVGIPAGIWGVSKVSSFIFGAKERSAEQIEKANENTQVSAVSSTGFTLNPASALSATAPVPQTPDEIARQQQVALHQKYLNAYTVEVANDDAVRPASIVRFGGRCRAYNMYGDGLNITQAHCLDMLKNPSKMPHARKDYSQTPNNAIAPAPMPVPANTVSMPVSAPNSVAMTGKEYVFNADNSHEGIFKN